MFEAANSTHFYFTVEGLETSAKLQVLSFEGLEAISSDYAIEVVLVCNHLRFDVTQLLSKPAFLSFDGYQSCGLHGVIQQVRRGGIGKGYALFKVVMSSQLSHLKRRMNQKVFRKKTVPEIISEVLTEYGMAQGMDFEFTLKETYEKREYTTQYDQTDYDLINHLAESEGIFYYFTHAKDGHKLLFADANPFFKVRDEAIVYKSDTGFVADERVAKRFEIALSSVTTETAFRNYNFTNMKIPEGSSQGLKSKKLNDATEINLEAYDYPSRHSDESRAKQLAKIELERFRTNQVLAEMDSDVIGLHAGQFIQVTEHPLKDVDEHWLIQEIRHAGKQPTVLEAFGDQNSANDRQGASQLGKYFDFPTHEALQFPLEEFSQGYRNVAVLSPKDTAYRPQNLHPKPKVFGTQTAIITGPKGEEIYCDEYGRVKIQCHWDRLGKKDDNSSDWVRVRSNWAHNGYGAVTIPRIGMEVAIEYEEGNPDFPMVVGALHNGINKVPYSLPDNKTRTVFKTNSSKNAKGSNEVRIEDKASQEQIYIHAQKDQDIAVEHNETLWVGNDRAKTIGNNEISQIGNNQKITVGNSLSLLVAGNSKLKMDKDNITLEIGDSRLVLTEDGIYLTAPDIHFVAEGTINQDAPWNVFLNSGSADEAPELKVKAESIDMSGRKPGPDKK